MTWSPLPINTTFDKARRKEAYGRLASVVRRRDPEELPELDQLRDRVRLFEQSYVGVLAIPVNSIVGTAGGSADFDGNFLPRRPEVRERWMRVERAFPDGDFPPIVVYQVGDSFYVVDGHHRVGVARQKEIEFIDAEVTKLHARFEIPPGADIGLMILAEQHAMFMEESGLERTCPECNIEFSLPHGYIELLELMKIHAYHLSNERREVVPLDEAALHFHDRIYQPTVEAIKTEGLYEACPGRTEADLFLHVYERRRSLFPEWGVVELVDAVRVARDEKQAEKAKRIPRIADRK